MAKRTSRHVRRPIVHAATAYFSDGSLSAPCDPHHAIPRTRPPSWTLELTGISCPRCQKLLKEIHAGQIIPGKSKEP